MTIPSPMPDMTPQRFAAILRPIPKWTDTYEQTVEYHLEDIPGMDFDALRADLLRCEMRAALEYPCHWWIHERIRALRAELVRRDSPPDSLSHDGYPSCGPAPGLARSGKRFSMRGGGLRD